MNEKTNPENDSLNYYEEYWKEGNTFDENEPYFPLEEAKPPHYWKDSKLLELKKVNDRYLYKSHRVQSFKSNKREDL